jgi:hypothetical protein
LSQPERETLISAATTVRPSLEGSVLVLMLFDTCEEIQLPELNQILGARRLAQAFKHAAPEYVRFERPPVVEQLEPARIDGSLVLNRQIKYYDYGVVSVIFEIPFAGEWEDLITLSAKWMAGTDFEREAERLARKQVDRAKAALVRPYENWLSEDYFIFNIRSIAGSPTASELIQRRGADIARVVRGETIELADSERTEVLQSSISYYPADLSVISWNAAFVYDTPSGAETAIQLLEYANSQLLEFRHYDDLLTRELGSVYNFLKHSSVVFRRWRLGREAYKLQSVTVEVNELVERADNAIKFLSDMFSARLYRLAAAKVGVHDYKSLVNQKLHTAEDLYRFLIEGFQQARAFVLELMVVVILVIELVFLFHPTR